MNHKQKKLHSNAGRWDDVEEAVPGTSEGLRESARELEKQVAEDAVVYTKVPIPKVLEKVK